MKPNTNYMQRGEGHCFICHRDFTGEHLCGGVTTPCTEVTCNPKWRYSKKTLEQKLDYIIVLLEKLSKDKK